MSLENVISVFIEPSSEISSKSYDYNDTSWSQAQKLYQKQQYPETVRAFLRYLDLNLISQNDSVIGQSYTFHESSATVSFKVTEDHICIEVPFVKMASGGKGIAAKRKLLIIAASLNDVTIECRNHDEIYFVSKSLISQCHPSRLIEMLRSVSEIVDYYDDLFVRDFSCELLNSDNRSTFSAEELERLWNGFTELKEESKKNLERAQTDNYAFAKPLFAALLARKILYSLQPHGLISTLCYNFLGDLNRNGDLISLNGFAEKFMSELDKITVERFPNSVYIGESFFKRKTLFDADHFINGLYEGFYFSSGYKEENENRHYTAIAFYENIVYGLLAGDEKLSLIEKNHLIDTLKRVSDAPREKDAASFLQKALVNMNKIKEAPGAIAVEAFLDNVDLSSFNQDFEAQAKFSMEAMLKMREDMMKAIKGNS